MTTIEVSTIVIKLLWVLLMFGGGAITNYGMLMIAFRDTWKVAFAGWVVGGIGVAIICVGLWNI